MEKKFAHACFSKFSKDFSFIFLLTMSVSSASSDENTLNAMKTKYEKVDALTTEFTQKITNITLGQTKESTGRIYILRPDHFRWETLSPEPSILTSNGIRVWYYIPPFRDGEKGQVTIKNAKEVPSRLAIDLMAGRIDLKNTFTIQKTEEKAEEKSKNGILRLKPKKSAGDLKSIDLYLEDNTKLVYKVVLHSASGNETEIELKNTQLGIKLPKSMFSFIIPKNTEVLH